ncbi:MAG TPA: aldo/keto reductase [Jiangellaceae bacterium]|nr:aldo/keto reductase [Jiangellaceae bacterium]
MKYRTVAGTRVSALCLGTMLFGTRIDEATSFAILDRYLEAGGTFVDTSNNYAFWFDGATGDESESTLGSWLAARDTRDQMVIGTKVGARPRRPGDRTLEDVEGLSRAAILGGIAGSLQRLGTDHVDVYYPHVEDRTVPLTETIEALAELVADGMVRTLGVSNHAVWRVDRARERARSDGHPTYTFLQYRYSFLQPRLDIALPSAAHVHVTAELLDYLRAEPGLALVAYSPLLEGAYVRADRPLPRAYDHPGTRDRLEALQAVANRRGATANQVVLAWLLARPEPTVPLVGVSSLGQLDEALDAVDLELTEADLEQLDEAG